MATLGDIAVINDNITNSKGKPLKVLYEIIFGTDATRLNRNKLKKFSGFGFNENDDHFQNKLIEIKTKILADLISVCHIINVNYEGTADEMAKRILLFLCNLRVEDDGDEEEEEEDEDENPDEEDDQIGKNLEDDQREDVQSRANPEEAARGLAEAMTAMKFPVSFRDVEDSIRKFDGKDGYPIERWLEDFEETSLLMNWNDLQKVIFAKKSLDGLAKMLVQSERGITSWEKLRKLLKKEFQVKTSSAEIHKMLMNRKKRRDETVQEYVIAMREIGSRVGIEAAVIIEYIIDGIKDEESNKFVLYGARNFDELKDRIKLYETIKTKTTTMSRTTEKKDFQQKERPRGFTPRVTEPKEDMRSETRCYSCGEMGHRSNYCRKGIKCFKCNRYGHKAIDCRGSKRNEPSTSDVNNVITNPLESMCKNVDINNVTVRVLIDTGSQINIIKETTYRKIGSPGLKKPGVTLKGFARGCTNTKGYFDGQIKIDDDEFTTTIHVVTDEVMLNEGILGAELLTTVETRISTNEIKITRKPEDNHIFNINIEEENTEPEIGETVTKEVRDEVKSLIEDYCPNKIKETNVEMKIIVKHDEPISSTPRRLPFVERDIVKKQIDDWLKEGVVEISNSEYASPIVLTRKKGGAHRLCIDYRKINKIIVKDRFPIPLIEDILDKLQKATIFSSIDLKNGFFHVSVSNESRPYTAFITQNNLYQFRKMPFGLCNSPAVFQKFVNTIFRELINQEIALVYIDDLIILAKDEKEALDRLKIVLNIASEHGLEINKRKCHFLKGKIEFLGYVIENGQISPNPEKVKAVMNFPKPKTTKQVQSFLGLTGYFRKFIQSYSIIAKPLSDLMKKGAKFKFEEQEERAFQDLKRTLSNAPVLKIFQEDGELELHADASIEGYGAILMQRTAEDNDFHPVYYYSRKTTPAEKKYISYELEMLAVIKALEKFRVYLLGRNFKIITDCSAFQQTMDKAKLSPRVARWALSLGQFDYSIHHRSGSGMRHVDSLSRHPVNNIQAIDCLTQIKRNQEADQEIRTIKEILKDRPFEDFLLKDGIVYRQHEGEELLMVPKAMQMQIIAKSHGEGHLSRRKMGELIKKDYYIPKLTQKIDKYVANCISCILTNRKQGKQEGYLHPIQKEEMPLHTYHIDHLGPLQSTNKNYNHILAVIDAFTKFVWLYPTKSTTSHEVVNRLELQKQTFGSPAVIISDQGTAFTAREFEEYCKQEGIQHHAVTTGLPRANGQVERINSVIISVLSKLSIKEPSTWYKYVPKLQRILNSTFKRSIQTTSFELLVGTPMRSDQDHELKTMIEEEMVRHFNEKREDSRKNAKEQIAKIQKENQKTFNKKRKPPHKYQVNDKVAIKNTQVIPGSKLKSKYFGPYRITRVKPHDTYDVQKEGIHEGPVKTKTCAEYLKPWLDEPETSDSEDSHSTGSVESQDGRAVGTTPPLEAIAALDEKKRRRR